MKPEHHYTNRSSDLRAAVMGANDGIISMSSFAIVVSLGQLASEEVTFVCLSALFAGALSMAAGEYISVSSQVDIEQADIEVEKCALQEYPEEELRELARAYEKKGLTEDLAMKVAKQLSEKDVLKAHLEEEIKLTEITQATPGKAAFFSFLSFLVGGFLPISFLVLTGNRSSTFIYLLTYIALVALSYTSARLSGVSVFKPIGRILVLGTAVLILSNFLGFNL